MISRLLGALEGATCDIVGHVWVRGTVISQRHAGTTNGWVCSRCRATTERPPRYGEVRDG